MAVPRGGLRLRASEFYTMRNKRETISGEVSKFSKKLDLLLEEMRQAEIAGKIEVSDIVELVSCGMGTVMAANVHPDDWEGVVLNAFQAACVCLDANEKQRRSKNIATQ